MNAPLLTISGIAKAFGGVQALAGVSFEVGVGERVAVIGPNGGARRLCSTSLTASLSRTVAAHSSADGH
jgi:branched-chain amino acid transport system ATP-binding protein